MFLPIFPLNGAVLFPATNLPLNIFEDRYIEMVNYALSLNRLIGMVQQDKNGKLFKVGCVGKITNFNETKDGRYLINLQGINCFKIKKEIKEKYKFRIVDAANIKTEYNKTDNNREIKDLIFKKYALYLKNNNFDFNLSEFKKLNSIQLAKFIVMASPFDDLDKQMLLEINGLNEFYKKLISVLEIELANISSKKTIN